MLPPEVILGIGFVEGRLAQAAVDSQAGIGVVFQQRLVIELLGIVLERLVDRPAVGLEADGDRQFLVDESQRLAVERLDAGALVFNDETMSNDWLDLFFNQNFNQRYATVKFFSTANFKIGGNILSNRFISLNGQIELSWLNESYNNFKIKCKSKFLCH